MTWHSNSMAARMMMTMVTLMPKTPTTLTTIVLTTIMPSTTLTTKAPTMRTPTSKKLTNHVTTPMGQWLPCHHWHLVSKSGKVSDWERRIDIVFSGEVFGRSKPIYITDDPITPKPNDSNRKRYGSVSKRVSNTTQKPIKNLDPGGNRCGSVSKRNCNITQKPFGGNTCGRISKRDYNITQKQLNRH